MRSVLTFFALALSVWGQCGPNATLRTVGGSRTCVPTPDITVGVAGTSQITIGASCTGWVLGTGWSCSNGTLVLASGNTGIASYHSAALQTAGKVLRITITATIPAYSSLVVAHCGGAIPGLSVGTITARASTYTCTDTSDLQFIPGAYTTSAATITSVSVQQVSGSLTSLPPVTIHGNTVSGLADQTLRRKLFSPVSTANELLLSLFDGGAGTEWTSTGGTAAVDDATNIGISTKGIKLGSTNNANSRMDKVGSWDLTGFNAIRIKYYVDDPTQLTQIQLFFATDNGYANYYSCTRNSSGILAGWNDLTIQTSACTTGAGAPSWTGPILKIRANVLAPAAKTVNVTFGGLWMVKNANAKATILLTFDDGDATVFSTVKNILAQNKMAGTAFVIPAVLGSGAYYMTLAQVKTLQDAFGWDIACHTYDHVLLTTTPVASLDDQFDRWFAWAAANQIQRVPVIAYPQGSVNAAALASVQKYFVFGRLAGFPGPATGILDPVPYQYQLPVYAVSGPGSQTALATAQGWVDSAVTANGVLVLVFHNILAVPVAATDWPTSDFTSLIAYIATKVAAGTAQVVTFSQLIEQYFPGAA